jgi:UDP-N-acetylmuramate dehydrogenase
VNAGGATAKDVNRLMEEMKRTVKDRFGVDLQPEIQIVGEEKIS